MIKKILMISLFLSSVLGFNAVYAGFGIDCTKPTLESTVAGQLQDFSFTCKNNTDATFSSFELTATEIDNKIPFDIRFTITWPNTENDIRPNDVGVVTGTIKFFSVGEYYIDFDKAYNGEKFRGIFCQNGKHREACINAEVSTYVYVTNFGAYPNPYAVTKCTVNANSLINNCGDSGASDSVNTPAGIAFLTLGTQKFAYITNTYAFDGVIIQCEADDISGELSNCQVAGSLPFYIRHGIEFHVSSGTPYAYIIDGGQDQSDTSGYIWKCDVNTSPGPTLGFLSNCDPSGQLFEFGGVFFDFKTFNNQTYAYVPDGDWSMPGEVQQVWKCAVDPITGDLAEKCVDSGAGQVFDGPIDVAFTTLKNKTFAYFTSYLSTNVAVCEVNTKSGSVHSCKKALTTSSDIYVPDGIEIKFINGKTYVYSTITNDNEILQCTARSNGLLKDCVYADVGTGILNLPFDIVIWPE